jgi:uncharacterized protein
MNATNESFGLGRIDVHVHLSLNGQGSLSGWSRRRWVMRPFLAAAAHDIGLRGGFGGRDFDERYLNRLVAWLEGSSLSAAVLLAYDWVRDSSGFPQKDLSDLYVSNEAVITVARRHPKFLPGVSIHPARPDAFDELERCADQGAALLKLLPCVQNVDCNENRYKPFWERFPSAFLPIFGDYYQKVWSVLFSLNIGLQNNTEATIIIHQDLDALRERS